MSTAARHGRALGATETGPASGPGPSRRVLAALLLAALVAATLVAGVRGDLVNEEGWSSVGRFWAAMWQPEVDPAFLRLTAEAGATTLSYAVLGTALSLGIGLAAAPLVAARPWSADGRRRPWMHAFVFLARRAVRLGTIGPRGVNEVVWALVLAQVLGPAPLVAVLAIGLPFGAVTAGVFADTLDESDERPYRTLREHGAGRVAALAYGALPIVRADLVSYAWYRFECAIRAAAILGIVGAGGLGYQIDLSFQTLRYEEMWTMLWALVAISAAADAISSSVRRRQISSMCRCGDVRVARPVPAPIHPARRSGGAGWGAWLGGGALAIGLAWWWVGLDPSLVWDPRRLDLAARLIGEMTPPRLGPGGWVALGEAGVETLVMSLLAIAASATVGLVLALLSFRPPVDGGLRRGPMSLAAGAGRALGRFSALLARSVPAPVWVFLAVLVLYPGVWPGVVALAIYNAGVMARLFAESLEDADPRPAEVLRASGAGRIATLSYATLPALWPRLVALSVYRWEVIMRETVVVGVVGAGGLGRLIKDDIVARDFAALSTSLGALVALTGAASVVGGGLRRALR